MQLLNDIREYKDLVNIRKVYLIAFLTALSGILSVIDTMIPKPIPMAKIGVANLVTLVLIIENRPGLAFTVAFLRTLIASLMIGSFLTYTYLLSLTGAMFSVIFTMLFFMLLKGAVSEIGLSVIGAFFNTISQGIVVMVFFGFDRGTVFLISVLILISIANGIIIGFIVRYFYKNAYKQ